jgi:DNA modification methylase
MFQTENAKIVLGDCIEELQKIESDSVHYSIYSPPFASLYTYSASERDMGNCSNNEEFFEHYAFLAEQLYRVLKPGRLLSFHCMLLPTSKERDGFIGLKDFRGDLIRAHQKTGMIYHSEVVIWKDPVTAMQRTKALGLLHKQIMKDSCMSRQGIPDYLVTMRKPGVNDEPVSGKFDRYVGEDAIQASDDTRYSIEVWQRYASPVWMDINPSDTLQHESAREHEDERHICPLQLQVIERGIELWSNEGDVVLSPFTGIGSEGYVAVRAGRRFLGVELKRSYYEQACRNIASAEALKKQAGLFDSIASGDE